MSIEERMDKAIEAVSREWAKIRTGIATPSLLDEVTVDYFGAPTPISHVSSISVPEPRLLQITPWEKGMLDVVEKAIHMANMGLTPVNDGTVIRISIPPLTTERRQEFAKKVRKLAEDARIAVRNIRRDENDKTKKEYKAEGMSEDDLKGALDEIQSITDGFIKRIDVLCSAKEEDILKV
ncbi:MAG: ribosome recycling factor [Fibrobacterales bacterium]